MKTNIVSIGNSQGVRIPKPILEESGLSGSVELKAKKGEIRIISIPKDGLTNLSTLLSEKALSVDWNKPEEDLAWASLK